MGSTSAVVDHLNQRLADSLGRVRSGTKPRFQWMLSTETVYYFRESTGIQFEAHPWADRIGKCWVLAQWRAPELASKPGETADAGKVAFGGNVGLDFAVMANGNYFAHPETALPPGQEPTAELTQNYIWALDRQMTLSYEEHLRRSKEEMADDRTQRSEDWRNYTRSFAPAFNNWAPGVRGYSTSVPYTKFDRSA